MQIQNNILDTRYLILIMSLFFMIPSIVILFFVFFNTKALYDNLIEIWICVFLNSITILFFSISSILMTFIEKQKIINIISYIALFSLVGIGISYFYTLFVIMTISTKKWYELENNYNQLAMCYLAYLLYPFIIICITFTYIVCSIIVNTVKKCLTN